MSKTATDPKTVENAKKADRYLLTLLARTSPLVISHEMAGTGDTKRIYKAEALTLDNLLRANRPLFVLDKKETLLFCLRWYSLPMAAENIEKQYGELAPHAIISQSNNGFWCRV